MYCKQQIVRLYFEQKVSYGNIAQVVTAEGCRVLKKTVWATIRKYKDYRTLCRLPGSGWYLKSMPEVLDMIDERM